mgnify:CR=1 FL=1
MKFTDKVNLKNARYIINLDFKEFSKRFWSNKEMDADGNILDCKTHYDSIYNYCMEVLKNKDADKDYVLLENDYYYSKNASNGRIYVKGGRGVQNFQGTIRKFLTEDYLLDIDIVNAHPSILLKIIKDYKLDVPCHYLEKYVKNRNKVIDKYKFNKIDLLMNLNSDKLLSENPYIKSFHNEKQQIYDYIIKETDIIKSFDIVTDNKKNPISSTINKLLCIKENIIINSVIKHKTIVPMFDGFMFEKQHKEHYDKLLLNNDPYIKWSYKENKSFINIDEWDERESRDYHMKKEIFEESNCMVIEPFKFIRRVRNRDGIFTDAFYSEGDFIKLNRCIKSIGDKKGQTFINRWLNDENKRVYEGIDFRPYYKKENDKTKDYIYNLFDGFISKEIEDYKSPDWFINFINQNISDGNEEVTQYLINYISHIIKHPDENPEIAIVIRGETGTGKDTLIEIIESLFGKLKDMVHRTADMSEIFPRSDGGSFNSALKNKIVIQLNEADGFDAVKVKETIKDQVTRKYNFIKEKYMKDTKQINYCRIFFVSNQNSPVAIEYNDRRFMMVKTSTINKGNSVYWDNLYKNHIYNQDELNNLFSWLGNRDITNFNPSERPLTKVYQDAISCSIPNHIRFIYKCINKDINKEYSLFEEHPKKEDYYYIKTRELYDKYEEYLIKNHLLEKGKFKSLTFKKQLLEFSSIQFKTISIYKNQMRVIMINKPKLLKELEKYNVIEENVEIID